MSASGVRGGMRVSIETGLHDLYKQLSEGKKLEDAPFETMKDIFMLAACLGYDMGEPRPLDGGQRDIFHWTQFSDRVDVPILNALAIAETGDIQVLADQEQVLRIAEEYANAGIREIREQLVTEGKQPLWSLVDSLS